MIGGFHLISSDDSCRATASTRKVTLRQVMAAEGGGSGVSVGRMPEGLQVLGSLEEQMMRNRLKWMEMDEK